MRFLDKFDGALASAMALLVPSLVILFQTFHFTSEGVVLPLFLAAALVYVFLSNPPGATAKRPWRRAVDYLLATGAAATAIYLTANFGQIQGRAGIPHDVDIVMGLIALVVLLEGVRRHVGLPLVIIGIVFVLYAMFGRYLPTLLIHRGYELEQVAARLYLGSNGYYGLPLATMFRYVVIFVIFGTFLERTGASEFLLNVSKTIAGRYRGGVGQVSVFSSALMGSVSGSAVANVATTGAVTIPAMKRTGFSAPMAGAIEAVASNGGQILPPVMGAAAFLMAEFLQIPYLDVVKAAAVPALLYFVTVAAMVYLYARRHGIRGLSSSELPKLTTVLKEGWYFIIPFAILIGLLVSGRTPISAGLYAILSVVAIGVLKKTNRLTGPAIIATLKEAGQNVMLLILASAAAGIIIGVLAMTGLGNRLSSLLVALAAEKTLLLLVLSMLVSIVLGMGMPTSVVYIMLATLVAPAMIDLGVSSIAAHLFILFFGTMSMLTPPVALSSYAGASIAGAEPNETSYLALRLALPCYFIPFFFVYNNALLLEGGGVLNTVWAIGTAVIGIVALSAAVMGQLRGGLNAIQRMFLAVAAFLLIRQGFLTDLAAFVAIAVVVLMDRSSAAAGDSGRSAGAPPGPG